MAIEFNKAVFSAAAAAFSLVTIASSASAADLYGSVKDAPPEEPTRRCSFSVNIGGTSDYVFRGITQTLEDPAVQGGADATCGMFYAGVWGSGVDFGGNLVDVEVDFYAGIKPTWGPLTFDLGVIYYAYPDANDPGVEFDYVELKGGVSGSWNNFALGGTLFWSPDYTLETGNTLTSEGSIGYTFAAMGPITPSVSALIGHTEFLDDAFDNLSYTYWNAGLALAVDKFTFDFRYWDSNGGVGDFCGNDGLCDERFVFTAKVTLP